MGLIVDIFRCSNYDSKLNAFYGKSSVTVVNIPGPFNPSEDAPAARLATNAYGNFIIKPVEKMEHKHYMFGGTFAHASDSRFSESVKIYGAVPIHDRCEG